MPESLHRQHLFTHERTSSCIGDAVILHLFAVPPEADAEHQATVRDAIEGRDLLGESDRVVLCGQADPGAEANARGHGRRRRQLDVGVGAAKVFLRQFVFSGRWRSATAGRNVRVLGQIE